MSKWARIPVQEKVGAQKWANTTKNARGSSVQGASEAKHDDVVEDLNRWEGADAWMSISYSWKKP